MNNLEVPDDLLMIACGEARDIYLNSVVKPLDIYEHDFSLRFEARMHKLIRKTKNSKKPGQVFWRVAAAIIIFLSVSFASLMSVEAYREKILEIITSVFKDRTEYRFSSEAVPEALVDVMFEYLPEGLNEDFKIQDINYFRVLLSGRNDEYLDINIQVYNQNTMGMLALDTEDATVYIEKYDFGETTLIEKNGITTFFWSDQNVIYTVHSNLDKKIISDIALGITVITEHGKEEK